MTCQSCSVELPAEAKFCPACGAPVPALPADGVATGGGAYVAGQVDTGGGDFVGRDAVVHGNYYREQGARPAELAQAFQAVYQLIDAHAARPDGDVDPDVLRDTARKIEQEAARGEDADPGKIRRWLTTLGKLAPDVAEVVVNALINPAAAVASGVKLAVRAFTGGKAGSAGG